MGRKRFKMIKKGKNYLYIFRN
ncbi:hypothetical protein BUY77_04320 [Staphylococcus equorum]|nr:hypothetical protein BUY77_04320 [Staphylococcus equorum]RIL45753.1 hypothetical protein BUY82_13370 [Staphylococcus equorum]